MTVQDIARDARRRIVNQIPSLAFAKNRDLVVIESEIERALYAAQFNRQPNAGWVAKWFDTAEEDHH
jgi:hypothetical protein